MFIGAFSITALSGFAASTSSVLSLITRLSPFSISGSRFMAVSATKDGMPFTKFIFIFLSSIFVRFIGVEKTAASPIVMKLTSLYSFSTSSSFSLSSLYNSSVTFFMSNGILMIGLSSM